MDNFINFNNDLISIPLNHNGIYRGKNLGTINNTSDWIAFRTAHGIADNSYKDLYLGDYITVNDGAYNKEWMVAGFDIMYNVGDNIITDRGVLMIPRTVLFNTSMNSTNTTTGGYKGSTMNTSTIPTVVTNLQKVFSTYLLPMRCLLSTSTDINIPSMAGLNWKGASTKSEWTTVYATLMTEVHVYGSTVLSSSLVDIGEGCFKLPVFNYITPNEFNRSTFWLRCVAGAEHFCCCSAYGDAGSITTASSRGVRPLILLG